MLGLVLITVPLVLFSMKTWRSAGPLYSDLAAIEHSRSEPHPDARGRVDVLDIEEAIREAVVHVRHHHPGVNVDALDRLPIREK